LKIFIPAVQQQNTTTVIGWRQSGKKKTRWNSDLVKCDANLSFQYLLKLNVLLTSLPSEISPFLWPNRGLWCCVFITLQISFLSSKFSAWGEQFQCITGNEILQKEIPQTQTSFSTDFGGKLSFIPPFLFPERLHCCYTYHCSYL